jgi:hypothetical protein
MRSQLGEVTLLLVTQAARADASADIFLSKKKSAARFLRHYAVLCFLRDRIALI